MFMKFMFKLFSPVILIVLLLVAIGCKKEHVNSKGLISTKNYHDILILQNGDSLKYPDVAITTTNDTFWNGIPFHLVSISDSLVTYSYAGSVVGPASCGCVYPQTFYYLYYFPLDRQNNSS